MSDQISINNTVPAYAANPTQSPDQKSAAQAAFEKDGHYIPEQQPQQQYQQTYQTVVPLANLQEAAAPVDCPACRHRALTVVEKTSGNTVHLWAALACVVCCLGCVPYLMSGIKDVKHSCGHCGVLLAVWHKSGRTVVM